VPHCLISYLRMKNLLIYCLQSRKNQKFLKKAEFWSTIFLFDPLAIPLTKIIAKTKITPNQISISTIFSSILAAVFFLSSQRYMQILGAVTFYLTFVLDCVDGKLARLTNTQSEFGAKLDYLCDHFSKLFILLALIYSQFYLWAGGKAFIFGMGLLFIHYLLHCLHLILIGKNAYKEYPGYRELLAFKTNLGRKFIKQGIFPSLYSYSEEKHLLLIAGPILGLFREFLVISLFLSLALKIIPELILLFPNARTDRLKV